MKKIYLLAAAAALFAACSSDKVSLDTPQQPAQLEEGAVGFDAYTQRAITRGGWPGTLNTATLQGFGATNPKGGFGVFGYYTDNNEYDQRSTPNFFYNQLVYWDGGYWTYEPLKYWPNEYGTNAVSEDQDKVTYFAYAPWINVIATSGKLAETGNQAEEWGITGMTRNSNQGDPILKYIATFSTSRSVDLCWGVADNNDGVWPITKEAKSQTIANGTPWIDVERPANTGQKVKFTFKHALAQLRINIDAFVDGTDNTGILDPLTRIWVREVTFKGFAMKGALNLHNEDPGRPRWLDYGGQNELVAEGVTVFDGRKDGKEGVNGAVATNEKVLGLNPILVQDGIYKPNGVENIYDAASLHVYGVDASGAPQSSNPNYDRAGVTKDAVPLFDQYATSGPTNQNFTVTPAENLKNYPFHVIPTDEPFEVEIVYDVETVSGNLAQNLSDGQTKGTSIENRIRKEIVFYPSSDPTSAVKKLEAGHSYTLNLHLGMNSVKFDAAVTEWIDVEAQDVDLPLNAPKYAVGTPTVPAEESVTIPFKGDYTFAITGFDGGESMDATNTKFTKKKAHGDAVFVDDATLTGYDGTAQTEWELSKNAAKTNGIAIQTMTTRPNPNTTNQIQYAEWVGKQSGKTLRMIFTQQAHPLFLKISAFTNEDREISSVTSKHGIIELTRCDDENKETSDHWNAATGWFCSSAGAALAANDANNYIKVYRNGNELALNQVAKPDASEFDFTDTGSSTHNSSTGAKTGTASNAYITLGEQLKAGDVIKVVLKTGDAPEETATAIVGGISYAFSSQTVTYYNAAGHYTYKPDYYGSSSTPNITLAIDPSSDYASIADASSGTITTTKAGGSAKIKATLNVTSANPLDLAGTATFDLYVVEQESKIVNLNNDVLDAGSSTLAAGDLKNYDTVLAQGKEDGSPTGGTVTFEIEGVTRDGNPLDNWNTIYEMDGTQLKSLVDIANPSTTDAMKDVITVKASGGGKSDYYKNAKEEKATFTVTIPKSTI